MTIARAPVAVVRARRLHAVVAAVDMAVSAVIARSHPSAGPIDRRGMIVPVVARSVHMNAPMTLVPVGPTPPEPRIVRPLVDPVVVVRDPNHMA